MFGKVSAVCGSASLALALASAALFLTVCHVLSSSCPAAELSTWGSLLLGAIAIAASVGSWTRREPRGRGRVVGLVVGSTIWAAWCYLMFT